MYRRATTLAVSWLAGQAGHHVGDYLVQRDCDAQAKNDRTPEGRRALARHAVTYGLTQAVTRIVAYRAAGLRVSARAQLAGFLAETVAHGVIDDGRLLALFAQETGKHDFYRVGAPRSVSAETASGQPVYLIDEEGERERWDNPTPSSGRALMDQAAHVGVQVPLGALITTILASRRV
ncbi:MAG TPA: hypothetical protein VK054_06295, partial [Beutenbergiaceae bacterium]|nr:hypothetical protein [Beutenbergiaceae bacterium]